MTKILLPDGNTLEPSHKASDGSTIYKFASRILDCEGCGELFNEDTDPWALCELDGATICLDCHADCDCSL